MKIFTSKLRLTLYLLFFLALSEGLLFSRSLKQNAHDTTVYYQPAALNILKSGSYIENGKIPLSMPGYCYFLAFVYRLFSPGYEHVRLVQSVLAGFISVIIFLIAFEIAKSFRSAFFAACLTLVFPIFPIYATLISPELLSVFFTSMLMLFIIKFIKYGKLRFLSISAILLGINILIRPEYLFFTIFIIPFFFIKQTIRKAILSSLLFISLTLLILVPNTLIFYSNFGKIRLIHHHGYGPFEFINKANKPFYCWLNTWYDNPKYLYPPRFFDISFFPAYAFNSEAEKNEVADLLLRWKKAAMLHDASMQADYDLNMVKSIPEFADISHGFIFLGEKIRKERPLKVFIIRPVKLAFNIFVTSKTEIINQKTFLQSLKEKDIYSIAIKTSLFFLNLLLLFAGLFGALSILLIKARRSNALLVFSLLCLILFRIAVILPMPNEPRMVLQAYIAFYILAGIGLEYLTERSSSFRV